MKTDAVKSICQSETSNVFYELMQNLDHTQRGGGAAGGSRVLHTMLGYKVPSAASSVTHTMC